MSTDPLRVLIADDEPLAREGLSLMLAADPRVVVVGEAGNGRAAVELCERLRPDIVLLDISMPDLDGFGVVGELGTGAPVVVFITAHGERAIRAFEAEAADFVLKPFGERRLREAIDRAVRRVRLERHAREAPAARSSPRRAPVERLEVRSGDQVRLVDVTEIDWIEASDDYVRAHAGGRSLLVTRSMRWLESRLDPRKFARIHRSTMVNIDRVRQLFHHSHGDYTVVMADGARLRMSRRRRSALLSRQ